MSVDKFNIEGNLSSSKGNVLKQRKHLDYFIEDIPPIHITLIYSVQQVIANLSGPIAVVYIIHLTLCTEGHEGKELLFSQLLSTAMFMMGVATLMQCTFGTRIPVVQGSSASFIPPILAMMTTDKWRCPVLETDIDGNFTSTINSTFVLNAEEEPWKPRLREISGCLMAASLIQVIFGCTGVMGILMNYIGPLTICPVVTLIGLSTVEKVAVGAQQQWGIALLAVALIIVFSMLLGNVKTPLPTWSRKGGCSLEYFKIFKLFPHLFSIGICWLLCYILTVTDTFTDNPNEMGYLARTDARLKGLYQAKWFFFPIPFQWGMPTFSVGLFVGLIGATLASITESIGDYYATAGSVMLPPPPKHAVNRGIIMEGLASIICGLVGSAHATTSYSATVGFIRITGMGSRFVWQIMAAMFIVFGVIGKFGAALTIIPDPIISGIAIVTYGMVVAAGLSNLQYIDLNSARNLLILAISLMLGMMMPFWVRSNPGIIQTGSGAFDQLLQILLSTGMFIGGLLGFLLDNIIPGTREERGLISFNVGQASEESSTSTEIQDKYKSYDLPLISNLLRKIKCCSFVPFLPSYEPIDINCPCHKSSKQDNEFVKVVSEGHTNAAMTQNIVHDETSDTRF